MPRQTYEDAIARAHELLAADAGSNAGDCKDLATELRTIADDLEKPTGGSADHARACLDRARDARAWAERLDQEAQLLANMRRTIDEP